MRKILGSIWDGLQLAIFCIMGKLIVNELAIVIEGPANETVCENN